MARNFLEYVGGHPVMTTQAGSLVDGPAQLSTFRRRPDLRETS